MLGASLQNLWAACQFSTMSQRWVREKTQLVTLRAAHDILMAMLPSQERTITSLV
jgi:hypothetical protein